VKDSGARGPELGALQSEAVILSVFSVGLNFRSVLLRILRNRLFLRRLFGRSAQCRARQGSYQGNWHVSKSAGPPGNFKFRLTMTVLI
jgi:hypothetical protein